MFTHRNTCVYMIKLQPSTLHRTYVSNNTIYTVPYRFSLNPNSAYFIKHRSAHTIYMIVCRTLTGLARIKHDACDLRTSKGSWLLFQAAGILWLSHLDDDIINFYTHHKYYTHIHKVSSLSTDARVRYNI